MPVLNRSDLEASPLSDLHALASELGLDGFRRLRKADLIDRLLERQGGAEADTDEPPTEDRDDRPAAAQETADTPERETAGAAEARPRRRTRGRRERGEQPRAGDEPAEDRVVEGTVELLGNGSGFLRVSPPDPSDDDVYVSAAQVRRCELVSGDVVSGPARRPRRSERYPSLVRVDTINGRSADEVGSGAHYDELPAEFPSERFAFGSEDATLQAIEWLTPIGRGSRVTISGAACAGKTETLRRLAAALSATGEPHVTLVLAGVRPEEIPEWRAQLEPQAALALGTSVDAQAQALERAADSGRRIAARGENAILLIDGLDGAGPAAARRTLAAARKLTGSGSLTVIATAREPLGGETTVIALDAAMTRAGRLPALDLRSSATMHADRLVGEAGAEAIAKARADAAGDGQRR